jgi:U1 small nuclear ribonucleoprotein
LIRNAFSTLFVARLSYETTDRKLKRELEQYGAVKDVKIVTDTEGRPRGYAFVEFEREDDMAEAYKRANGRKIDGRRVVVDVERGRCVCHREVGCSVYYVVILCMFFTEL